MIAHWILAATLQATPPAIECPPYPGDPVHRAYTCYILSRMGEPDTRIGPREPKPEPVERDEGA